MIYLDASALLRVLFDEPGPRVPLGPGAVAFSSRLIEVESHRAVDRARLLRRLSDGQTARKKRELEQAFAMLALVPVDDAVLDLAKVSFPVNVRALDAIHVATAQHMQAQVGPVEFWTHAPRQANAALARGLDVRGVEA